MRGIDFLTHNWALKLTSLVVAVLLWITVRTDALTRVTVPNVPVDVVVQDPDWRLAGPPAPTHVDVTIVGRFSDLVGVGTGDARVTLPIDEVSDTLEVREIEPRWIRFRAGLDGGRIEAIRPGSVRLAFERLDTRLVDVAVTLRGRLPDTLALAGEPRAEPPAARVSGPVRVLERLDSLPLRPVDLARLGGNGLAITEIDTTGLPGLIVAPRRVRVLIPVVRVSPDTVEVDTTAVPDTAGRADSTTAREAAPPAAREALDRASVQEEA